VSREIEVRFNVPAKSVAALAEALGRGTTAVERYVLEAVYHDTADRRLAAAGLSWRVRREGRRWFQTVKAAGASSIERLEFDVARPDGTLDPRAHADTPLGGRLADLLTRAEADGIPFGPRFRTRVRRETRRIRTRGAVVDVSFNEGRLVAGSASARIREVEFELAGGSPAAMLALVERWRARHGLLLEPRGKAERGDRLADGLRHPPVRKAAPLAVGRRHDVAQAFGAVFDECFDHLVRNAIGLVDGDPGLRVEHVHQARVAIRRLRSALRCFRGWIEPPPDALVRGLREVFAELGRCRDSDVLDSGVAATLARVGAPPLRVTAATDAVDPAALMRSDAVQRLLVDALAWRTTLAPTARAAGSAAAAPPKDAAARLDPHPDGPEPRAARPWQFEAAVERRLKTWHRSIAADAPRFDELDEASLHALRKRIKRQRYAVEFFAPLVGLRKVDRYLGPLAAVQERMGELNDLFVARTRYEALVRQDPAAWFALGWLAARIAELRTATRPALERLAAQPPPTR
jgi:triphosphatase